MVLPLFSSAIIKNNPSPPDISKLLVDEFGVREECVQRLVRRLVAIVREARVVAEVARRGEVAERAIVAADSTRPIA